MMPFEPYDYQIKCAKDNLLNTKQISLACTSCLDENTEIEVEINEDNLILIEKILGRKII